MTSNLPQLLFIEMPGGGEMLIILVVVLLLFGGKKIPELMRGLGRGVREFNDAKSKITTELEEGMKEKDNVRPVSPATGSQTVANSAEQAYPASEETTYTPHTDTYIPPHSSNGKM